ncbi:hypothetical protein ACQP1G_28015 [Nocardia sp. CA-107356]|uniref:hypothetical protein n=1 Tax=Nocardia sp. CA-107356 TaxID=3239972 RepID=UPI003D9154E7
MTSSEVPDPVLNVPPTVERDTEIRVRGNYWPCTEVMVYPSWSDSVHSATVSRGSFDARVAVSDRAGLGSQSILVECSRNPDVNRKATLRIDPAKDISTTTTTEPSSTTTTESLVSEPSDTPTAAPVAADPQRDNHFGDVLGIGAVLLAVGVATLVLHGRRKRAADPLRAHRRDPHLPQVRVQVLGDLNPSIHVREFTRSTVPAVRVRVSVGDPRVQVREVPR